MNNVGCEAVADPKSMNRTFKRELDELGSVFGFLDDFAREAAVGMPVVLPLRLAIEELFTNMVRYNSESTSDIHLELERSNDKVEVVLTDHDVEPFDLTQHGAVDTTAKLEDRNAGGLGIHLVKRMVDEIHYHYSAENRESRITLIKSITPEHA